MGVILGVESSCDETAMALVKDGRYELGTAIASQIDTHALYGGVVPEIASRMHVEALDPLLDKALADADMTLNDIDAIGVTYGPGLVGALLTGLSYAKALAYALNVPLIPVNHIEGHISANYIAFPELEPPFLCLVASGGHSDIVNVKGYGEYEQLGQTVDDAAGEAFDKVARALDIPYPGGALLDKIAETGDDKAYKFPHVKVSGKYDFSFSGLKTAVINEAHTLTMRGEAINTADFAASFRRAVIDQLADKAISAAVDLSVKKLALAGGVAANLLLRRELERRAARYGIEVFAPPARLCTDNASMIAAAAYFRQGRTAALDLNAQPALRGFE